jgi:transposase-like protein
MAKRRYRRQPKFTKQMTLGQFDELFPTDEACKTYLVNRRWPDGVVKCPRCGNDQVYTLHARPFHWLCRNCLEQGYRFSVLVETIFEDTKVGLRDWFRVIHMMLTSKKGIAALEVQRVMGFGSYHTAHYMCHRIRAGLVDPEFRKLVGIVETDETFVGGKAKNRHKDKRGGPGRGGMGSGKIPVVGAVERNGNVVARVIDNVQAETLSDFVRQSVDTKVSLLCTDQWVGYNGLANDYPHEVVDHSVGQYVVGAVHTQTIEGFWSLIKRGIMGTFHKVSRKYLPLYVAEFEFRYNHRRNPDIFGEAVGRC